MKISYSGCAEPIVKAANWRKRKIEKKFKKLHLREVYQISSFTAFPGGSSMENAGLDPASSCSEHSCLRQGPGGTLPCSEDLKAGGVCGGHCWDATSVPWCWRWHRSLVLLGWCPCLCPGCWESNPKLCPNVIFVLGVCSVHFELQDGNTRWV